MTGAQESCQSQNLLGEGGQLSQHLFSPRAKVKEDYTESKRGNVRPAGEKGFKVCNDVKEVPNNSRNVNETNTVFNKPLLAVYQHKREQGRRIKKYSGSYMPSLLPATNLLSYVL